MPTPTSGAPTSLTGLLAGSTYKKGCNITASKTSGSLVSIQNPLRVPVIAQIVRVHIKEGSDAACTVDVGTATTNVTSDNLIDGMSVNAAANTIYDNITDGGTNGKTRQYLAAGSFLTAFIASGNANGLVADFYFDISPFSGGDPNAFNNPS